MLYRVKTLSSDNVLGMQLLNAGDESELRRELAARGLFAAVITPLPGSPVASATGFARRGQSFSLSLFGQEILALLQAGLGIVEALEALVERDAQSQTGQILQRLLAALRDGKRFSAALAEQPEVFPALFIGVVKTAEGTSDLPQALTRYLDYLQRITGLRQKLISAAVYPTILLVVGGGVSLFLTTYVVPRFAQVYQGSGRNLPWMTEVLLRWGRFAAEHAGLLLTVLGLAAVSAVLALRWVLGRVGWTGVLSQLPGIGQRLRIYELSRLYLTLGMLNEGGIPVVASLDIAGQVLPASMRESVQASKAMIESGMPLSSAFEAHGLTTSISLRLLRVGERTGNLGRLLTQSALFYDGEISRWIDRFTRAFEPLLMAAIGIVVGVIVVLLYMPIFDLAGGL